MGNELSDVLDRARRHARLSPIDLWLRYFGLGGMDSPLEVDAYLFGALQPSTHEHDLLVHALNERFAELGLAHPIPYADPRITLGAHLGQVRAALWNIDAGPGAWDRACRACAEALSVTGAGIILLAGGEHRTSLGISDEVERVIEEAQFTLGEGPCIDAARLDVPVHEPDLAASGRARWPIFTPRALAAGVAAIFALPLRMGTARVGAMNLYRNQPGPLSETQLADAVAVAGLVAHAVLTLQADAPTGTLAPGLADVALRAVVHQASGMVAVQLGTTVTEALIRLRGYAYAHDRSVDDVAAQVVARTLRFGDQPD